MLAAIRLGFEEKEKTLEKYHPKFFEYFIPKESAA